MRKSRLTALMLLCTMLASCAGTEASTDTTAAETTAIESEAADNGFVADSLPSELDFNQKAVTWFVGDYMDAYWDEVYAEEANGSRVNDAVYNARKRVEERLNVKFEYYRKQTVYDNRNDIKTALMASILADDKAYDVFMGRSLIDMVAEDTNSLLDLSDNKYIDFEKPWWNKSMLEIMPDNTAYEASGDGSLSLVKHAYAIYFNNDRLRDFGVTEDLYKLVADGKWTLAKLEEITKLGYRDVNGNTVADYGDEFGLTFGDQNKFIGFFNALEFGGALKGADGYSVDIGSEHAADAFDALYNLVHNTTGVLIPGPNSSDNKLAVMSFGGNYADKTFADGNTIFTCALVGDATVLLGNADFEYGVLPYPKLDESQENYKSAAQRYATFAIPSYADAELSGAVIEAWSSEAYRTVQPEYFETTLKTRYSYDSEMSAMFDLIKETIWVDPTQHLSAVVGANPSNFVKSNLVSKKEGQWASTVASNIDAIEAGFEKVWEIFK